MSPTRKTQRTKTRTKAPKRTPSTPPRKTPMQARTVPRRADYGAPIDGFFARQPPPLRAILAELRSLVEAAAPEATGSIKWGMPFFAVAGEMMCALGAHRAHVNLILPGPPGTYADPDDLLEGEGRTGKHLKIVALETLPRGAVRGWLRTAAERARGREPRTGRPRRRAGRAPAVARRIVPAAPRP